MEIKQFVTFKASPRNRCKNRFFRFCRNSKFSNLSKKFLRQYFWSGFFLNHNYSARSLHFRGFWWSRTSSGGSNPDFQYPENSKTCNCHATATRTIFKDYETYTRLHLQGKVAPKGHFVWILIVINYWFGWFDHLDPNEFQFHNPVQNARPRQ